MFYRIISNIYINEEKNIWPEWDAFKCENVEKFDLEVTIELNNQIYYGLEILDIQEGNLYLKSGDCLLCANLDWSFAKLISFDGCIQDIYRLFNALLFTHLSRHQALEMHASLIDIQDIGIMFLGPSGIGKTTQAELWMKYRKAQIVNGDMVFVKQESDCFLGCGSPWHGSSPYCMNKQVPLKALIVLKQSSENRIRRLTGFEMVSSIMNSVFFPIWYQKGHEAVCKTLNVLLQTVPVYELSCRPDEDAVRLTEETVFGNA